jgi:outer membrane biosynthesis protein TonB
MVRALRLPIGMGILILAACGGSQQAVEEPPASEQTEEPPEPEPEPVAPAPTEEGSEEPAEGSATEAKPEAQTGAKEPEFKEGMTVDEAIAAVPRDAQRMNVDSDALGRPLMDQKLYAPCKLGQNQHFKVRVAIWNGKAVGLDLTTQPNNPKAAQCIASQIRSLTWKDKVPSLNSVEYSM